MAVPLGFTPLAGKITDPQAWYGCVDGAADDEREANLAQMMTGIYNSPKLIATDDPDKHPNGVANAYYGRQTAYFLRDWGLIGPTP
ncbi:hypothetical protein ACFW93_44510 [Streptomyces canus]|uniref:hypothetical protein n=1 Tax=Streptomyces canus TaxID=58343 RepID=UPI003691912F